MSNDEVIVALDLQSTCERFGYQVSGSTGTAELAFDFIKDNHPDLVLMDIMLNGEMNGIEAVSRICGSYHIPVIFVTAHSDPSTLEVIKHTQPYSY